MVGTMRKAMIYLGLADGEELYEEEQRAKNNERQNSSAQSRAESSVTKASDDAAVDTADRAEGDDAQAVGESTKTAPFQKTQTGSARATSISRPSAGSRGASGADVIELGTSDYRAPVTPIKRASKAREEATEVHQLTTIHPRSYEDAKLIGDSFRSGIPVIMNVTDMNESEAKRLVDFAAGLVFGLHGAMDRVTSKVFLLTPTTVDVVTEGTTGAEDETLFFNQG